MRTAVEQQIITKITYSIQDITPAEIQAITPELLNSKINNGSYLSECTVAFALANFLEGQAILAANDYALARQINPEILNAIYEEGQWVGESVAFALAYSSPGQAILAANHNELGLQINAKTLNYIIQRGRHAGYSVAFLLARFPAGLAILAANNNTLALKLSPRTLKSTINWFNASNGVSIALERSPEGQTILAAIRERHKNNNIMFALYSAKIDSLGKKSIIRILQRELIDGVITMLDGRTPRPS